MNIISFKSSDKVLLEKSFSIRTIVFIQEMNVHPEEEFVDDDNSTHYLLFDNDKAVACSRWRETPEGIKLERFAVLKSHRSKGLGRMILKHMLAELIPLRKQIYLYAQIKAIDFYRKNGFTAKGDEFLDAGIKHILMEYEYE